MAFSHRMCDHPATPAARKVCRTSGVAANVNAAVARIDAHGVTKTRKMCRCGQTITPGIDGPTEAGACGPRYCHYAVSNSSCGPIDRDIYRSRANHKARSRIMGVNNPVVRDSIRNCVQAELHTAPGRCACGWSA
jgi:hypothetical protein